MTGLPVINFSELTMSQRAVLALYQELDLTPKPGLVDQVSQGAHRDMDYRLFARSINTIAPWFSIFESIGREDARSPASQQLQRLRPAGISCEYAMFSETHQVNTHKGGIFSLGLICCAAGRLDGRGEKLTRDALCRETSAICHGIVRRELSSQNPADTAGRRIFRQYLLTGARGEAESGFQTLRRYIIPYWFSETPERRLHSALLRLMAVNPDTNLIHRGGPDGLRYVQQYAQHLLTIGWTTEDLWEMDRQFIARNLSPGGSADLLAVALVLMSFSHG